MPIEGILDLQRRGVPLGEIRIGTSVEATSKAGKAIRKPVRLETFRFTTASEHIAKAVAAKYGGTVAPWSQRKGRWEVITDRTALDVWVPPRGGAVDANMELWDGPKRLRKCNGITESISGRPCQCPRPGDPSDPVSVQQARDERKRLAGLRPAQACKPLTRINVTIPGLPGLTGVFRLSTGSENAAVETADSGDAMVIAREGGVYLPAVLRFEWRNRATDGSPYPVPVLEIGRSMQELAEGALPAGPSGLLAQLKGTGPGEQPRALTAATAPAPAATPEPEGFDAKLAAISEMDIATAGQQIVGLMSDPAITPAQMGAIKTRALDLGVWDDQVCTDDGEHETWEEVHSAWQARWDALALAAKAAAPAAAPAQDALPVEDPAAMTGRQVVCSDQPKPSPSPSRRSTSRTARSAETPLNWPSVTRYQERSTRRHGSWTLNSAR